jgi:protein NrfC
MAAKDNDSRELSRRNFLKIASGTAAGVVLGGALYGLADSSEKVSAQAISEGYLVVDSKHCIGCMTCMMICSLVHEGKINTDYSRIQIINNRFSAWPDDIQIAQCRQCVTAPCVMVCPTGACHIDEDNGNARVIDGRKYIGCQMCIQACPFIPHRTIWNSEKNVSMKCDFCANTPYWDEEGGVGGKQACVEACPVKAIRFVNDVPDQVDEYGYEFDVLTSNTESTSTGGK